VHGDEWNAYTGRTRAELSHVRPTMNGVLTHVERMNRFELNTDQSPAPLGLDDLIRSLNQDACRLPIKHVSRGVLKGHVIGHDTAQRLIVQRSIQFQVAQRNLLRGLGPSCS